jgi:hypothetical protein
MRTLVDICNYSMNICGAFKLNAFTYDDMKLKLFGQTVTAEAKAWLLSHPAGTFDTWKKLCKAFLAHYYPEKKAYKKSDVGL